MKWDLFAEIQNSYDVEQLASGLISIQRGPVGERVARLRADLSDRRRAALPLCGWRDIANLWRLLTMASAEELRPIIAGTPAQPFLDPDNARMFGSIRSVAGSAIAAFEYIQSSAGRSVFGARVGAGANTSRSSVHSVQGRANRGPALDDRGLDAARDIRSHEPDGRIAISACGSWSTNSTRWAPSTDSRTRWRGCENLAAAACWDFNRSRKSRALMDRAKRRRSWKIAATRSFCAAPAARTAARRNSRRG